jgi:hypothetical protein
MAQPAYLTDQQVLGQTPETADLSRQRKIAELLMTQGMEQPQGQMISGHYVAPSWSQQIAPLAKAAIGTGLNQSLDAKQAKLVEALRGKKLEEQKAIMEAINSGDTKKALALASQSEYGGKEFVAPLLGNVIPKAPEIMSEKDKEDIRIRDAQNKLTEQHYRQMANQQANTLAMAKVPMGYRPLKDGSLEAIPGGPADIKAQTVNVGKETVNTLIGGLKDEYNKLLTNSGITSTAQPGVSNIPAYLSSSGAGQMTGKLLGTENQSARNTIAQSRPLLLAAIKSATGMSAKQMDSNVELKLYLAAATDPTLDYETNIKALNQLETLYGSKQPAADSGWRIK